MREGIRQVRLGLLEWLGNNWLGNHLAFIPIGTWVTTWLLVDITGAPSNWWVEWEALQNMGQAAPFGAATYGAFMLPMEAGVRVMFWAISQFIKDLKEERKRIREERDEELRKEAEATGVITLSGNVQFHVTRGASSQEESSPDAANEHC